MGHESSPNSMHMTKMLHPLEHAETAQEISEFPIPVYSEENNRWVAKRVQALKEQGLASVGNMQCTVWGDGMVFKRHGKPDDGHVKR